MASMQYAMPKDDHSDDSSSLIHLRFWDEPRPDQRVENKMDALKQLVL